MQEAWACGFPLRSYGMGKNEKSYFRHTGEWMTMPLVLKGDVSSDNVFMRWALHVTGDSNEYIRQWMKFTEELKTEVLRWVLRT